MVERARKLLACLLHILYYDIHEPTFLSNVSLKNEWNGEDRIGMIQSNIVFHALFDTNLTF